jgi:hypothetical protein
MNGNYGKIAVQFNPAGGEAFRFSGAQIRSLREADPALNMTETHWFLE